MSPYIAGQIEIDKVLAFAFGVIFATALLVLAVLVPNPTESTMFIFRVILALVAAGIGAVLPGLLRIDIPGVRAGGALALAVMVYYVNPPSLVANSVEQKAKHDLGQAYGYLNRGNFQLAHDYLDKIRILVPEPLDYPFFLES